LITSPEWIEILLALGSFEPSASKISIHSGDVINTHTATAGCL